MVLISRRLVILLAASFTCLSHAQRSKFTFSTFAYPSKAYPDYKCPEDWILSGSNCYRTFNVSVAFDSANAVCKGYGGSLAQVSAKTLNEELGNTFLSDGASVDESFWIGFQCDTATTDCSWSSGQSASPYAGFWSGGQPDLQFGECTAVDLQEDATLGPFRWSLTSCSQYKMFVCQSQACVNSEVRCSDGSGCISPDWVCDGSPDCPDYSDEEGCAVTCGTPQSGDRGRLASPNYPNNYYNLADCRWELETEVGKQIQLTFLDFSTENSFDVVEIYSGWDVTADNLMLSYGGKSVPRDVTSPANRMLVVFRSDHANEDLGFAGSWEAVEPSSICGGDLTAETDWKTMFSPGYPISYPENIVCTWTISNPSLNVITLQVLDFDTAAPNNEVKVYNGDVTSQEVLAVFTGDELPKIITSSSNVMTIVFTTVAADSSHRGFSARYRAGCQVVQSKLFGVVESPSYSVANYANDLDCSWTLQEAQGRPITLIFTQFQTEKTYDFVKVYNSSTVSDSHLQGTFSGSKSPGVFHSNNGQMLIEFVTDPVRTKKGWHATYSIDCPLFTSLPAFAILDTDVSSFQSTVTYSCVSGFRIKGQNQRTCGAGGRWLTPEPECVPVTCPPPNKPLYGTLVNVTSLDFGGKAIYACNHGYRMNGSDVAECGVDGWSHVPICEEITCPEPESPDNGNVSYSTLGFGAEVVYSCAFGFVVSGETNVICTAMGNWSAPAPTCHGVVCLNPLPFANGEIDPASPPYRYGDQVEITCDDGYLTESRRPTCQGNATWDARVECADINECTYNLTNPCGEHLCVNLPGSYTCRCLPGYEPTDPPQNRVCADIDECAIDNAGCDQNCTNLPGSYFCSCQPGYTLYVSTAVTSGNQVANHTCTAVTCPGVTAPDNSKLFSSREPDASTGMFEFPTTLEVTCEDGYTLSGEAVVECQPDGSWSSIMPTCTAGAFCPQPADIANGSYVLSNGLNVRSLVRYNCDTGFKLLGSSRRECLSFRQGAGNTYRWSGSDPTCKPRNCGPLDPPVNGAVEFDLTTYSARAMYTCDLGFQLSGDDVRLCQANATWSGTQPSCNVFPGCPHPGAPRYGSIRGNAQDFPLGAVASFQCDRPGYELTDPWPLKCSLDLPTAEPPLERTTIAMTTDSLATTDPTPTVSLTTESIQPGPVVPECHVRINSDYEASGIFPSSCDQEYGVAVVRKLQGTLAQLAVACTGLGTGLGTLNTARVNVVNTQVNIGVGVRVVSISDTPTLRQVQTCALSVEAALTDMAILDSYPTFKTIDDADLVTCDVPLTMNPEQINSEGVDCEVCPPDYIYNAVSQLCEYSPVTNITAIPPMTTAPGIDRTTMPSEGITTESSQDITTMPSEGITTESSQDITTMPSQGITTESSQDITTMPSQGVTTEPSQNVTMMPSRGITTEPLDDSTTEPTEDMISTEAARADGCWVCDNAASNADCLSRGSIQQCQPNQESCETEIRIDNGNLRITKRCKQLQACQNNARGNTDNCPGSNPNPFCFYCCTGGECNSELPINPLTSSKRRRRDVDTSSASSSSNSSSTDSVSPDQQPIRVLFPQWNATTPNCVDVEPPVWHDCPSNTVVELGPDGPVLVNLTEPYATDNSGQTPSITTDPANLRYPVRFLQNTTVTLTAVDQANNEAVCSFDVALIDVTPPSLECPVQIYIEYHNSSDSSVPTSYPIINATDFVGVTSLTFFPPEGSMVVMRTPIIVTVRAMDKAGNEASCDFTYVAQPLGCPDWSLPVPEDGEKACSGEVVGLNGTGYSCNIACPRGANGFDFVIDPANYICVYGGSWLPNNWVPDCTNKLFPDYELNYTVVFLGDSYDENCTEVYAGELTRTVQDIVESPCDPYSSNFNVTVRLTSINIETDYVSVQYGIHFSVVDTTGIGPTFATFCSGLVDQRLRELTPGQLVIISTDVDCANLTNTNSSNGGAGYTCPDGHIFKNGFCLECTPGMYNAYDDNLCVSCPIGTYQDELGQTSCKQCPPFTSTIEENTKNISDCVDLCSAGHFSTSTLVPCDTCPKGTYQANRGGTGCDVCPTGTTTLRPAATNSTMCRGVCQAGTYSNDGLTPCTACPKNYFQEQNGSRSCVECETDKITEQDGTDSSSLCIDVDWCSNDPCMNDATCENKGRVYDCNCAPGFTGRLCDIDIDECLGDPCNNNATCLDGRNNFTCTCLPGYEGPLCERVIDYCVSAPCVNGLCYTYFMRYECQCNSGWNGTNCDENIDECAVTPCLNNGTCTDLIADYSCQCDGTGYEGRNCEVEIDECESDPCLNGATCVDRRFNYTCQCADGFAGSDCGLQADNCESDPCQNNGLCNNQPTGFTCTCQVGYTGITCETDIDECASNPCRNEGTCSDLLNGYTCQCPPGFEGRRCSTNVDECLSQPCANNGRCVDGVNSYTCQCLPGFTGTLCQVDIDECEGGPCMNGATCVDRTNRYRCQCPPGYTGVNCSVDVDECASSPCQNGAACVDGVNEYTCTCVSGWTGSTCSENVDDCAVQPCQNGASCTDLINDYICSCVPGYQGDNCEELVDNCLQRPCVNGGTCRNMVNNFTCDCLPGYEGFICDMDIDECASDPCQNGATCVDLVDGYNCSCRTEYFGVQCEEKVDNCVVNNTCLNGATCVDGWMTHSCMCTPYFLGDHCQKEKFSDFDLFFQGQNGSISRPPGVTVSNVGELSVVLWVRYAGTQGSGTAFTLARASPDNSELIFIDELGVHLQVFGPLDVDVALNDGAWHHVALSWNRDAGAWSVYVDGVVVADGAGYGSSSFLSGGLEVWLGQKSGLFGVGNQFHGELSKVQVYSSVLTSDDVILMAYNCTGSSLRGDVMRWLDFDEPTLANDVIKRIPSICGSSSCPPGYTGSLCDIQIDKSAPEVLFCPNTTTIVDSTNRLVVGNWTEPIFVDDVGVVNITKTHRPGQVFAYGQFFVTYVAYDGAGNSAACSFFLFVLPYDCEQPAPPANGLATYGLWTFGEFARIACTDPVNYDFVVFPPPFYKCAQLGSWDPPSGDPFRFPACAALFPPLPSLDGSVSGVTDLPCTEERKAELRESFIDIMRQLDQRLGLCVGQCDYSGVVVKCAGETRRRRRQAGPTAFDVNFAIPVNATSVDDNGDAITPAEAMEQAVKDGNFSDPNNTFSVNTAAVVDTLTCIPGQVINRSGTGCVNCAVGMFYNMTSQDCMSCESGTYQDEEAQFSCKSCDIDETTVGTGATNISECILSCDLGSFYDATTDQCQPCRIGYYQDEAGQNGCLPCGNGQTTENSGSTSADECQDGCSAGSELDVTGQCQLCEKGTYRDVTSGDACVDCNYGFTTSVTGATSASMCDVVECPVGNYLRATSGVCELCPVGTYQDTVGQTACIDCPKGTATQQPGSSLASLCVPGTVDRCASGANTCDPVNGICTPSADSFSCSCQTGFTGDGVTCTDNCDGFCENGAVCSKDDTGAASCQCPPAYTGSRCEAENASDEDNRDSLIAGVVSGSVAFVIIVVLIITCCLCRPQGKKLKSSKGDSTSQPQPNATNVESPKAKLSGPLASPQSQDPYGIYFTNTSTGGYLPPGQENNYNTTPGATSGFVTSVKVRSDRGVFGYGEPYYQMPQSAVFTARR